MLILDVLQVLLLDVVEYLNQKLSHFILFVLVVLQLQLLRSWLTFNIGDEHI